MSYQMSNQAVVPRSVPLRGTLVDTSQYPRLRSLRSLSQGLGIIQPLRGWVRRALRGYMSYQMSNQAVVPRSVPLRGTLVDTSQYPRLRSLRSLSQGLGIIQPLRGWVRRALRGYMSYQMSNQAVVPRRGTLMHNPSLSVAQTGGTRCTPSTCLGEVHTPQDI